MNTNYTIKQMSPQLQVANLERSIEFYTEKLGFTVEFRYEDFYAGIIKDGYSIHLKMIDAPVEKEEDAEQHLDIMFSIENIEEVYEGFLTKSLVFTQALRQMPYGKEFYIADPDENVLAFFEAE